jgi:hypothetical protein
VAQYQQDDNTLKNADGTPLLNVKLSTLMTDLGITPTTGTTYEVMMQAIGASGSSEWSATHEVFMLESPWVSHAKISTNEAYVIWGSTTSFEVIGAVTYEAKARVQGGADWDAIPTKGVPQYNRDDATMMPVLNIKLSTLLGSAPTTNATYEVVMRAISAGGVSSWSATHEVFMINGPTWIAHYLTTTTQTMATWEGVAGITSYEVNYGISTESMSWTSWAPTPEGQNYGGPIMGLTPRTWYQLRVNQHTGDLASTWSFVDTFFTIPAPNNVKWTGSTSSTASITWEPVNLDVGVPCTSYEVSYGTTFEADDLGTVMTSEPHAKLTMPLNTVFYVKVRARDDANHGWSDWTWYGNQSLGAAGAHPITITPNATITGIDVSSGWRGTTVKIQGANFDSTTGTVSFGATAAQPGYWQNDEIAVSVPPGAITGSNAITVIRFDGNVASHSPSTFSFNVTDGGVVIDDFEGGVWQYATCEAGGSNLVKIAGNYTSPPERNAYLTAECSGTAAYEIVGGVSTYGDDVSENGYDISSCKQIKIWFRGDGTSNVATFELVESNQAPGNNPAVPLAAEIWKYNVPISMSSTGWQQITIDLTTEGTNKFAQDTGWYDAGNHALDLNRIKAYQILTGGGNPKKYAVDHIYATTGVEGVVSNLFITREGDAPGSNIRLTWATVGAVDIWTKTGTFETNTASWVKEFSNVSGTFQVDSSNTVGSGINKWYKIVPAGTSLTTAMLSDEVLGKWDYSLGVGNTLISLPFIPFDTDLDSVIGKQLTAAPFLFSINADIIQTQIGGTQVSAYLSSGTNLWTSTSLVSMEPDIGYIIQIKNGNPSRVITVVGKTTSVARAIQLSGGTGVTNYVGTCYPVKVALNSSGLAPLLSGGIAVYDPNADKVQENYGGITKIAFKSSNDGLLHSTSLNNFVPGRGYIVTKRVSGNVTWDYPKTY